MRPNSHEYRRCSEQPSKAMQLLTAALMASAMGLTTGPVQAAAQEADVAFVEEVSGRVVASFQGKPVLLDTLDVVSERTRIDLLANSELRICHYQTHRLFALKGPLKASISRDGVRAENGAAAIPSAGSCAAPAISTFQGGLVTRNPGIKTMTVPLRPNIKIVNRGTEAIRRIALWDGDQRNVLMTFERTAARPDLDDGGSYLLVVERNDGSEFKLMLRGSSATRTDPLFVVIR